MAKPHYFPFYVKDFAADSLVEAMTTEEVGAYVLLLCKAWNEEPPGTIPDDDRVLAKWARVTPQHWSQIRAAVLQPFTLSPDGRLLQRRMAREYAQLQRKLHAQSEGGKKGAAARNGKRARETDAEDDSFPRLVPSNLELTSNLPSTRAYESDSDSESLERDEGAGEGKGHRAADGPSSPDQWPQFLAREWVFYYHGGAPSQRDLVVLGKFFASLIQQVPAEQVLARIRDRTRNNREPTWDFEKFWAKANGKTNGQRFAGLKEFVARGAE